MKILIATGIFPPDIGGPARMLGALADSLSKRGFGVEVLTYSENFQNGTNYGAYYNVHRIKKGNLSSKFLYFFKFLLLTRKADIVYTTDTYSVGYFAYLTKKFFGKKYILRFAGDSAWEVTSARGWTRDYITDFEEKVYDRKIEKLKNRRRKILQSADKIIAVSEFMKELAEKIGVEKQKIKMIYNSIEFLDFRVDEGLIEKTKKDLGLEGHKIIMSAGRLMPWKGMDKLVEIFGELEKEVSDLKMIIIGDGPEREVIKKQITESKLQDKVFLVGKVPLDKIFSYYSLADVFVLNSKYEGLSHILLEALYAGVPIVASDCGGNPEVVVNEKNGFLVEYNNDDQIKKSIKNVLAGFQPKRIGLEKFNWETNINKTVKTIKEVL